MSLKNIYMGIKQDKLCMYNDTLRHIHATTVAVEKQEVLYILSVHL